MKKFYSGSSRPTFFICFLTLLFSGATLAQTTYVVNSTSDLSDINLQDSLCEDPEGNCSLRAAIQNANQTPETDTIHFSIPGEGPHEIVLSDDLPPLTERIILDARTQPGYTSSHSQVILSGNLLEDKWDESGNKVPRIVVFLAGNSSGSEISGLTIGSIASTFSVGIYARETGNHKIYANKIGCTADGSGVLKNNGYGMYFQAGHNNLIGDENRENRNIISGNRMAVALDFSDSNRILNNFVGTDWTGEHPLDNGDGILTWKNMEEEISEGRSSSHNVIKGNIIVGGYRGIMIRGDYNLVEDNFIGTDVTGTKALGGSGGILLSEGNYNNIGGEKGNLISGNKFGITVYSSQNVIANNFIGTDVSGERAIPNGVGVSFHTKSTDYDCRNNTLEFNLISGNTDTGVRIDQAFENLIRSNIIGLNKSADTPLPNGRGVEVQRTNSNLFVENTIAANKFEGIIVGYNSVQERISKNSIYGNGEIGIDLADNGITENDGRDTDTGPNNLQNFPELESAAYETGTLEVQFNMSSDPSYAVYPLTIEFFKGDGKRQGKVYLNGFELTENDLPRGKKPISIMLQLPEGFSFQDGDPLTATATDANGNTSEFSAEIPVTASGQCTMDIFYADKDSDTYGDPNDSVEACEAPQGYVSNSEDCDDSDPSIHPGATDDSVDGIDQDCDGTDGPVEVGCTSPDLLVVSEVCSTSTEIFWQIENQGDCMLTGRWELAKASTTGTNSGSFELAGGELIEFTSGKVDKGKTKIEVYWSDPSGSQFSSSAVVSGLECTGSISTTSSSESEEFYISPNPITEEGIGLYFTTVTNNSDMSVSVFNSSGQLMASQTFPLTAGTDHQFWELDHSSWEEGTYVLQANLSNETYQVQFIK